MPQGRDGERFGWMDAWHRVLRFLVNQEKKDSLHRQVSEVEKKGKGKFPGPVELPCVGATEKEVVFGGTVGILTIKRCEEEAVLDAFGLTSANQRQHGSYTYHVEDFRVSTGRVYRLCIIKAVMEGQLPAINAASSLIEVYKPDIMVCCGIAGGVEKEVKLGDVIIGDRILYYEPGKVAPDGTLPDALPFPADPLLLDRCSHLFDWSETVSCAEGEENRKAQFHIGVIASGEKTIASPEKMEELRIKFGYHIIGVEKEGGGFAAALWLASRYVRGIVVRGVSDYAGTDIVDPVWEEKEKRQKIAAWSAASFVKHLVYRDPLKEDAVEGSIPLA